MQLLFQRRHGGPAMNEGVVASGSSARAWWRTLELWVGAGLGLALFLVALGVCTRSLPSPRKAYRSWTRGQDVSHAGHKAAVLAGVPVGLTTLFGVLNAGLKGPGYA